MVELGQHHHVLHKLEKNSIILQRRLDVVADLITAIRLDL